MLKYVCDVCHSELEDANNAPYFRFPVANEGVVTDVKEFHFCVSHGNEILTSIETVVANYGS